MPLSFRVAAIFLLFFVQSAAMFWIAAALAGEKTKWKHYTIFILVFAQWMGICTGIGAHWTGRGPAGAVNRGSAFPCHFISAFPAALQDLSYSSGKSHRGSHADLFPCFTDFLPSPVLKQLPLRIKMLKLSCCSLFVWVFVLLLFWCWGNYITECAEGERSFANGWFEFVMG